MVNEKAHELKNADLLPEISRRLFGREYRELTDEQAEQVWDLIEKAGEEA